MLQNDLVLFGQTQPRWRNLSCLPKAALLPDRIMVLWLSQTCLLMPPADLFHSNLQMSPSWCQSQYSYQESVLQLLKRQTSGSLLCLTRARLFKNFMPCSYTTFVQRFFVPRLFPVTSLGWGSVQLERTSGWSAFPVPCAVSSPAPPHNGYLKEGSREKIWFRKRKIAKKETATASIIALSYQDWQNVCP